MSAKDHERHEIDDAMSEGDERFYDPIWLAGQIETTRTTDKGVIAISD